MAGGLTYANTMGAVNGINQAGSGVTIPDTFLRWAQDVLFDSNGIIHRRAPFTLFPLYNYAGILSQPSVKNERVIGVFSTSTNSGKRVSGMVVTTGAASRILFYDKDFRNSVSTNSDALATTASSGTGTVATLTIGTHNFVSGQTVTVNGVTPLGYNGTYVLTGVGATTISYANTTTGAQTVAGSVVGTYISSYTTSLSNILPNDAIFNFKHDNDGGVWLGLMDSYATGSSGNKYYQYYWRGGVGVETTYSGATATNPRDAFGIQGSYSNTLNMIANNNIVPSEGMFVYLNDGTNDYYAGVVASATKNSITLEQDIIRPKAGVAAAANFGGTYSVKTRNVRPFIKNHSRGLLSLTTGTSSTGISGIAGTDGEGHWKSAGIAATGTTWALYKASDGAWLGDVASVTDNTTLVMNATYYPTTSITMKGDEYIARPYGIVPSFQIDASARNDTTSAGIFSASYAGLHWFGNGGSTSSRNRIVFSNYLNSESVDLSANDADSIIVPSLTEMRGLASSSSGLLIFMADKTFLLRGNSRFNFSLEELYPEGCLSSMSIVEYGGGVFWAGKNGILYFDGSTVRNITSDNLGTFYTQSLSNYNVQVDRVYGFFHNNYLFMHFTAIRSPYKPARYEPIYADAIDQTNAIKNFVIDDWDPDFNIEDFNLTYNTPIYWNRNILYSSGSSGSGVVTTDIWGAGVSQKIVSITAATGNGTTVTLTVPSGHGLVAGQSIKVSGLTPSGFNGTYTISTAGATTITYANTTNTTSTTVGAITYSSAVSGSPAWGSYGDQLVWGPADITESMTFVVYLPTNAFTVFSNFGFRNAIKVDVFNGLKTIMAANVITPSEVQVWKASSSGTAATIITSSPHSISTGDSIVVSGVLPEFDGRWTAAIPTKTITNVASSGTEVTVTSTAHGFAEGQTVTISGVAPSVFNGTYVISSVPDANTFKFNSFVISSYISGGQAKSNSIINYTKTYSSNRVTDTIGTSATVSFDGIYIRMIDVDSVFNYNEDYIDPRDAELIENNGISPANYYKGPDFYIQTKHYTMGDPLLKKWFRQLFLNLYLIDGAVRMDVVDNEDNDDIDIQKKQHKNWELFTSVSYSWDELERLVLPKKLSPNRSTWQNVEQLDSNWYTLTNTLFERRKKRFSWRYPSMGFRLYQLNNYRASETTQIDYPYNIILESWDIGFKPMRQSRV